MTDDLNVDRPSPSTDELRDRIEDTRGDLEQTVEALAAKLDVKARAKGKAAAAVEQVQDIAASAAHHVQEAVPEPVKEKVAQAAGQIADGASAALHEVHDKMPDPVLEKASSVAEATRRHRGPILAALGSVLAVFVVRWGRKRR